ncbi:MAG: non-canonical purine NTP pyrophosphatase [Myxococcota bacterium]
MILVTSNENKWREAQRILDRPLDRVALELPEIQAAAIRDVAIAKARAAWAALGPPHGGAQGRVVVVEDAGLELAAFGGFPGPFVKYWEALGGLDAICRSLDGTSTRAATAVCVLALCDGDEVLVAEGRVDGEIAKAPRGANGFGWDPIFVPAGETRTYAELGRDEKDARSHRRRAWEALRARTGGRIG